MPKWGLFWSAVFWACSGVVCAAPRTVTLVADTWCPYNCTPESPNPGYFVEAAQKALAPLGYKVVYRTEPWTRAIKDVTAGTFDILLGTDTLENPQLNMEKVSGAKCSFKLFTLPGQTFSYTGPQSLVNKRLGVVDNYVYSTELNAYIAANRKNLERVQVLAGDDALDRNIKKLQHNRIDTFPETPPILAYRLKELGISQTFVSTGNLDQNDRTCYMALSKTTPDAAELLSTLTTQMKKLEADGTLSALRTKYSVEP